MNRDEFLKFVYQHGGTIVLNPEAFNILLKGWGEPALDAFITYKFEGIPIMIGYVKETSEA